MLHIGKNNLEINYALNGVSLSRVLEHNDLGVLIDKKLSWMNHILRQVKKSSLRMYMLHRSFGKTSVVWSPSRLQDLETFENAQRRFTIGLFSKSFSR